MPIHSKAAQTQKAAAAQVAGDPALGFADGGPVFGPGGPRDDKIAAWLSNGEYVIPAHRVRSLGIDFLEALRRGGRALSGAIPRFADGGLVGAISMPNVNLALPDGAMAGGRPLYVNAGGGRAFVGSMPVGEAADLEAQMRRKQIAGHGSAPRWK